MLNIFLALFLFQTTIERLEKEKQTLMEKLKEKNVASSISEVDSHSVNANNNVSKSGEKVHVESSNENDVIISEPVKKLEQRFKETMERVAELTEEKQKLEHLVLQLQSETETIGTNRWFLNNYLHSNFIFIFIELSPFFIFRRIYNIISKTKSCSTKQSNRKRTGISTIT